MRHIPAIAGALLGLAFISASLTVLLNLVQAPAPPAGSHLEMFMGAFAPSGYLTFVKWCELIGGVLVAIPKTRGLGVLVLGPIVVNIFVFHATVTAGEGLTEPMLLGIAALLLVCIWAERKPLLALCFK